MEHLRWVDVDHGVVLVEQKKVLVLCSRGLVPFWRRRGRHKRSKQRRVAQIMCDEMVEADAENRDWLGPWKARGEADEIDTSRNFHHWAPGWLSRCIDVLTKEKVIVVVVMVIGEGGDRRRTQWGRGTKGVNAHHRGDEDS